MWDIETLSLDERKLEIVFFRNNFNKGMVNYKINNILICKWQVVIHVIATMIYNFYCLVMAMKYVLNLYLLCFIILIHI